MTSSPRHEGDASVERALRELTLSKQPDESIVVRAVQGMLAGDAPSPEAPGVVLSGRYTLQRILGEGAMGVVWLARDAKLERPVAVKRLRGRSDAVRLARLRREAQAVAQLSHPNVVSLFDVGEHGGRPFLVMEYVEGVTLSDWLRRAPRPSWRDIVDQFVAAGRGLAAAHREGLVHRDFKPENVLVGEDGRPRVADFGLARAHPDAPSSRSDGLPGVNDVTLTKTGTAVGTPLYMAPEQETGSVTAQADIFAFASSLFEALYQQRPYGGRTWVVLQRAKAAGPPPPPPSGVPMQVYAVVARGLAPLPHARWSSMDVLIRALARARRGHTRWIATGALAVVSIAGAAAMWPGAEHSACTADLQAFKHGWPGRHRSVMAALQRSPATPALRTAVDDQLAAFSAGWTATKARACAGSPDGGSVPSDRIEACLKHVAVAASVQMDEAAESSVAARRLADRLELFPRVEECDAGALAGRQPLPHSPALRADILDLRRWAEVRPYEEDPDLTLSRASDRIGIARRTGHQPTVAHVLWAASLRAYNAGRHKVARDHCEDGFVAAIQGGDDLRALDAAQQCTLVSGVLGEASAAKRWFAQVVARSDRTGVDPLARVRAQGDLALALARSGRMTEARTEAAQAFAGVRSAPGHDRAVLRTISQLGMISIWDANYDEAIEWLREGMGRVDTYFPDDADLAVNLELTLASAYRYLERWNESEAMFERVFRRALPPSGMLIAQLNYAQLLGDQPTRRAEAEAVLEAAEADLLARGGARSVEYANVLAIVGQMHFRGGRWDDARAAYRRAQVLYREEFGPGHMRVANTERWLSKLDAATMP